MVKEAEITEKVIKNIVNGAPSKVPQEIPKSKRPLAPEKKPVKPAAIATFVVGIIALIAGLAVMFINIFAPPTAADADFLVSNGIWRRSDEPDVTWYFSEIGKGMLTTHNYYPDSADISDEDSRPEELYDFRWALSGDQLQIQTDWLYELNDTFTYKLDQSNKTLTLTTEDGKVYTFVADESAPCCDLPELAE